MTDGTRAGREEARPALTIAIPTIPGRESLLSRCLWFVLDQAPDDVEVIVVDGPGLQGDKANLAASVATGRYMALIDDDDWLNGSYMPAVLPFCRAGEVDFVGYKIAQVIDHRWTGEGRTRGDMPGWARRGHTHGPVPKGLTRLELWREVPMGNHYTADRDWCAAMARRVRSHAFVDRCLYIYDHQARTSTYLGGEGRDVGTWPVDWGRVVRVSSPPPSVG